MADWTMRRTLYRYIMRLILFIICVDNYSCISFIYFLLLITSPVLNKPNYLLPYCTLMGVVSGLCAIAQILTGFWQYYSDNSVKCEHAIILQTIGIKFYECDWVCFDAALPHISSFAAACFYYYICKICAKVKYYLDDKENIEKQKKMEAIKNHHKFPTHSKSYENNLKKMVLLIHIVFLGIVAVWHPSLLTLPYIILLHIMLLRLITIWHISLEMVCRFYRIIAVYAMVHTALIYLMQLPIIGQLYIVADKHLIIRLFGLYNIIETYCKQSQYKNDLSAGVLLHMQPYLLLSFSYCSFYIADCLIPVASTSEEENNCIKYNEELLDSQVATKSDKKSEEAVFDFHNKDNDGIDNNNNDIDYSDYGIRDDIDNIISDEHRVRFKCKNKCSIILISLWLKLIRNLKRNSYMYALISMIIWSVTYVSIVALFYLLLACAIGVLGRTNKSLFLSPIILLVSVILSLFYFIKYFNLKEFNASNMHSDSINHNYISYDYYNQSNYDNTNKTLKDYANDLFTKLGFTFYPNTLLTLLSQLILVGIFYANLWSYLDYRKSQKCKLHGAKYDADLEFPNEFATETEIEEYVKKCRNSPKNSALKNILSNRALSPYGLIICNLLWIYMCCDDTATINNVILFSVLFYNAMWFRISFRLWRKQVLFILWAAVIYSMLSLVIIYCYQINFLSDYLHSIAGLSQEKLKIIGVQKYAKRDLFISLLTPALFSLAVLLYLKSYHSRFIELAENIDKNKTCKNSIVAIELNDASTEHLDEGSNKGLLSGLSNSQEMFTNPDDEVEGEEKQSGTSIMAISPTLNAIFNMMLSPSFLRALDLHWWKASALLITIAATTPILKKHDATNLVYIAILPFFMQNPHKLSWVYLLWSGTSILIKMIYQLIAAEFSNINHFNCSNSRAVYNNDTIPSEMSDSMLANTTIVSDPLQYFGLFTKDNQYDYREHFIQHASVLLSMVFMHILHLQQRYTCLVNKKTFTAGIVYEEFTLDRFEELFRISMNIEKHNKHILFNRTNIIDRCKSFFHAFNIIWKFCLNFGCYKFGVEASFIVLAMAAVYRSDILSIIFIILLFITVFLNRTILDRIWSMLYFLLSASFIIQFCFACGLPPFLCIKYPWTLSFSKDYFSKGFSNWLFLPSYNYSPKASVLIADCIVLIFFGSQRRAFIYERQQLYKGYCSSNMPVYDDIVSKEKLKNSFLNSKSADYLLNKICCFLFSWQFSLCKIVLLYFGFGSFNIFSLSYAVLASFYVFMGYSIFLMNRRNIVLIWNITILINLITIIFKSWIELWSCSNLSSVSTTSDWKSDFFTLKCWKYSFVMTNIDSHGNDLVINYSKEALKNNRDAPDVIAEAFLFCLLIIQRRVFVTKYFTDVRVHTQLIESFSANGHRIIFILLDKLRDDAAIYEKKRTNLINKKFALLKIRRNLASDVRLVDHNQVIRAGTKHLFYKFTEEGRSLDLECDDLERADILNDSDWYHLKQAIKKEEVLRQISNRKELRHKYACVRHANVSNRLLYDHDIGEGNDKHLLQSSSSTSDTSLKSSSMLHSSIVNATYGNTLLNTSNIEYSDMLSEPKIKKVRNSIKKKLYLNKNTKESEKRNHEHPTDYIPKMLCKRLDESTRLFRLISNIREAELRRISEKAIEKNKTTGLDDDVRIIINDNPPMYLSSFNRSNVRCRPMKKPIDAVETFSQFIYLLQFLFGLRLTDVCYFSMILYHIVEFSLASIFYPIAIFLWAMVSVPFAHKAFWKASIAYTTILILVKVLVYFKPFKELLVTHNFVNFYIMSFSKESEFEGSYRLPVSEFILLILLLLQRDNLVYYGLWTRDPSTEEIVLRKIKKKSIRKYNKIGADNNPSMLGNMSNIKRINETHNETTTRQRYKRAEVIEFEAKPAMNDLDDDDDSSDGIENLDQNFSIQPKQRKKQRGVVDAVRKIQMKRCKTYKRIQSPEDKDFEVMRKLSETGGLQFAKDRFELLKFSGEAFNYDYYTKLFTTELGAFFTLAFGYSFSFVNESAIDADESIATYVSEQRLPKQLLWLMVGQFVLMMAERTIYVLKSQTAKFVFHFFHVILMHLFLKIFVPWTNNTSTAGVHFSLKLFYALKCVYFTISAKQVLAGYPKIVSGCSLWKSNSLFTLVGVKLFMIMPLIFEIRSTLDWLLTETTLSMGHWNMLDNIYHVMHCNKCWRTRETDDPAATGEPYAFKTKLVVSVLTLLSCFIALWIPLVFLTFAKDTYKDRYIFHSCTAEIQLNDYTPIYFATSTALKSLNHFEKEFIKNCYSNCSIKSSPIDIRCTSEINSLLKVNELVSLTFDAAAGEVWPIAPALLNDFRDKLNRGHEIKVRFKLFCKRYRNTEITKYHTSTGKLTSDVPFRQSLLKMLNRNPSASLSENNDDANDNGSTNFNNTIDNNAYYKKLLFRNITSRFLLAKDAKEKMEPIHTYRKILEEKNIDLLTSVEWQRNDLVWSFMDTGGKDFCSSTSMTSPFRDFKSKMQLFLLIQPTKAEGGFISVVQGFSFFSILSVLMMSMAGAIRNMVLTLQNDIMYLELPNVDRILAIIKDIYVARAYKDFFLEEELFAKLLVLFRLPNLLLKYTQVDLVKDGDQDEYIVDVALRHDDSD